MSDSQVAQALLMLEWAQPGVPVVLCGPEDTEKTLKSRAEDLGYRWLDGSADELEAVCLQLYNLETRSCDGERVALWLTVDLFHRLRLRDPNTMQRCKHVQIVG